jgi:hypothetical protein
MPEHQFSDGNVGELLVDAELYGTSSDCTTPIRLCGTSMFDVAVGTSDQTSATQTSRSTTIARIRRFS